MSRFASLVMSSAVTLMITLNASQLLRFPQASRSALQRSTPQRHILSPEGELKERDALHAHSSKKIWSGALSLHFEIPELGLTYERALRDARDLGLTHVALTAQATLPNIYSDEVSLEGPHSTDLAVVRRVITLARQHGLQVILFPILWVEVRGEGEWRGALQPKDLNRWWSTYERWIQALAQLASEHDVSHLSVGSELSSLERYEGRWRALIRRVRASFKGALLYSANWDHYHQVGFWDALDLVGVTGYYPLAESEEESGTPSLETMNNRWRWIRVMLTEWLMTLDPPRGLMITELGYPSQRGSAERPWHYYQSSRVDLEMQRRAFESFSLGWRGEARLTGVNFWNLWGLGGPQDTWYTLRGKPAFSQVRALIQEMNGAQSGSKDAINPKN